MDDQDEIQKPVSVILYRQSSVETRLSLESSDDEVLPDHDKPKIVGCMKKKSENKLSRKTKSDSKTAPRSSTLDEHHTNDMINLTNKTQGVKINEDNDTNKTNTDKENVLMLESDIRHKFKDELSKKLQVGFRKSSGPPPPIRKSSIIEKSIQGNMEKTMSPLLDTNPLSGKEADQQILDSGGSDNLQKGDGDVMEYLELSTKKEDSVEYSVGILKALVRNDVYTDSDSATGAIYHNQDMATLRPKSPRPVPLKGEKEETIWDKLGTLGRKKRIKEVQEVQAEGKHAIDSPGCPTAPVIPPEDYNLDDNEERCMIDPKAYDDPKFADLLFVLKEWINDELASQRIIVQDLSEDLYDGQVLQKLLEKLTGDKLDVPEVTQSEEGQKQKLTVVLDHFNKVLGIQKQSHNKWNVESIHSKNIVAITHLLVALARHFRPPVRLPEHVSVQVVVVQKINGKLLHKTVRESLSKAYDDVGMRCERDAFDTLFDHAPDKLQIVKKSLVTFVNKHLNKMNFEVTEIESQFHDGVYLIMLMGLLEGFFVPHYSFHLTPHEFEQKVHNVNFAFELMEETGLQKPKARPEDVVNMDLKSTLRVLYNLFLRYRTMY